MIKKILLALLGLILLLVIGFFALGLLFPVQTIESRVLVNKPRDVAWKYFTDETKAKEWLKGLKSIEPISGEPFTAGSKYKMTFDEDGRQIVMTETVTEFKEKELFRFTLDNEVITADDKITFIDKGDKTEIVSVDVFSGGNIFWRSLFALMNSGFQKNSDEIYQKLKEGIERQN